MHHHNEDTRLQHDIPHSILSLHIFKKMLQKSHLQMLIHRLFLWDKLLMLKNTVKPQSIVPLCIIFL